MAKKPRKGRKDTSTGRDKRDKCTQREPTPQSPVRTCGTGQITSRARTAQKMAVERALRARDRRH